MLLPDPWGKSSSCCSHVTAPTCVSALLLVLALPWQQPRNKFLEVGDDVQGDIRHSLWVSSRDAQCKDLRGRAEGSKMGKLPSQSVNVAVSAGRSADTAANPASPLCVLICFCT